MPTNNSDVPEARYVVKTYRVFAMGSDEVLYTPKTFLQASGFAPADLCAIKAMNICFSPYHGARKFLAPPPIITKQSLDALWEIVENNEFYTTTSNSSGQPLFLGIDPDYARVRFRYVSPNQCERHQFAAVAGIPTDIDEVVRDLFKDYRFFEAEKF